MLRWLALLTSLVLAACTNEEIKQSGSAMVRSMCDASTNCVDQDEWPNPR